MRIVMLCSAHAVNDERVSYKQAASLAEQGHEVVVLGREGGSVAVPDVTLVPIGPKAGGLWSRTRILRRLYRTALAQQPDVVTCHEPESAWVGLAVRRRTGARVVFDVHEFYEETLSGRLRWPLRPVVRALARRWLRFIGRRCDWIQVVSPPMRDQYRAMRGDERVTIINNGPRTEMFPPCDQEASGPLTVCHDGHLQRGRGMVQILEALALARRRMAVRLLIVGEVEERDRLLYEQRVAALGLQDAIQKTGWVPYDRVGACLARAQVGLVTLQPTPNNFQGLGNKIFNYMCCGQAAIVPQGSATADLMRETDGGLAVDTTRPEEIADAIVRLAADPPLRRRLGANGRKAIQETYGWHKMSERLASIYAQLDTGATLG